MENIDQFKSLHLFEKHRIESFKEWPFDENTSCGIEKMAAAGFYWDGDQRDNDTVTCFVCTKTLDGWEATDDPWKEHAKHAPQCLFVKYGHDEKNLSVDEFISVFSVVTKNVVHKQVQEGKKKFSQLASEQLNSYLDQMRNMR